MAAAIYMDGIRVRNYRFRCQAVRVSSRPVMFFRARFFRLILAAAIGDATPVAIMIYDLNAAWRLYAPSSKS